ncbi:MAG TPA: hypothetical protein VK009_27225 [Chloroflexota bacterium]|nr:hypothetical protein [Chloroflexota bacterium]
MAVGTEIDQLHEQLVELANAQFETPEYRKLTSVHFTRESGQLFEVQRAHFVVNRRDCWGFAQGAAPLEVKRLIWAHEQEELMGAHGVPDHITLGMQEAEVLGMPQTEFERIQPTPIAQTCFWAWINIVKGRPWLESIASCSILEWVVSDDIIRGGGIVRRISQRMHEDLGIPLKEQPTNAVHVVADLEHANLLVTVVRKYGQTEDAREAILRGARNSLLIERVFRGHLADIIAGDYRL